jgi:hypothetical protein
MNSLTLICDAQMISKYSTMKGTMKQEDKLRIGANNLGVKIISRSFWI